MHRKIMTYAFALIESITVAVLAARLATILERPASQPLAWASWATIVKVNIATETMAAFARGVMIYLD